MQVSNEPYYGRSLDGHEPFQLLIDHLTETSELMEEYCSKFTCPEIGRVCGLLHDIGKYSPEFQRRVRGDSIHVDHATAGAFVAQKIAETEPIVSKIAYSLLSYVIAGHHTGLPNMGSLNSSLSDLCLRLKNCDPERFSAWEREITTPFMHLDTAINKLNFPQDKYAIGFSIFLYTHFLFSSLIDADRTSAQRFSGTVPALTYPTLSEMNKTFQKHMEEFSKGKIGKINTIRKRILKDCTQAASQPPGLFTLTVPTGGGKTLSSLMFALQHADRYHFDRIIYTIPFTSIIEQNASVYKNIFKEQNVLEHHSNFVLPKSKEDTNNGFPGENEKLAYAISNWSAPLILTTNVQFFESLFTANPSRSRKVHNIANSIIILDEVQALPIDLLVPCLYALSDLVKNYRCTVILCTATQPNFSENGLFPFCKVQDIISKEDYLNMAKEMIRAESTYLGLKKKEEIAAHLLKEKQVLCIVNTKRHASELYTLLQNEDPDSCYHLSTNMYPAHRQRVIATIKGRLFMGLPCRVVSTQLIEAGVDVDFPVVFRSLAGIDSIIQAAGRCNREGKLEKGRVYVFKSADGYSEPIYLQQTAGISEEYTDDFLSKKSSDGYFQQLFHLKKQELDLYDIVSECGNALENTFPSYPFKKISDAFHLISDDGCAVIIPIEEKCKKILSQMNDHNLGYIQSLVGPYCVNVRKHVLERLDSEGALEYRNDSLIILSDTGRYDECLGLEIDTDNSAYNGYIY